MRTTSTLFALLLALPTASFAAEDSSPTLGDRFAPLALGCVHQEYPNKIAHVMQEDSDAKPPRELTPAFFGCYDWHSSVHGHWLLARLARTQSEARTAAGTETISATRAALAKSLTAENLRQEVVYLQGAGRVSFERPYGLAWLLQLAAELRSWDDDQARRWTAALAPLETLAAKRFRAWIPKLTYPIRTGEHSQTAFAFGLVLDWAAAADDDEMLALLGRRVRKLYLSDRACPLAYEPSGQDFLSPCLAEADLVRRVLAPAEYAAWLGAFLPQVPLKAGEGWLDVAVVSDPEDPKLAHLDGLNLSRAWMLEGILAGLPAKDPRRDALRQSAKAHRDAGLAAVTGEHYEGGHWLGSFAVYLVTGRGLPTTASTSP